MIPLQVGQELPTGFSVTVTERMVEQYASVSGDYSSIHMSSEAAQAVGFSDKIAHGMLTMGISTRLFSPYLHEKACITCYEARFTAPIVVGETLHMRGKVVEKNESELTFAFVGETYREVLHGVCVICFTQEG